MLFFSKPSQTGAICKVCSFILTTSLVIFLQNVCIAQKGATIRSRSTTGSGVEKGKLEVGLAGGISLNNFSNGQPQTGSNTGYTAGLSLNYKVYNGLSVQVEANFLQQGGNLVTFKDDTGLGLPESFSTKNVKNSSVKLNSIEFPVLIKYSFKIEQTWKPAIYLGGSYAYTYNATDNYQKTGNLLPGEDLIATVTDRQNVTDLYNSGRINLIMGTSVQLPLSKKLKLLLDFRYLHGLSPARENYSYMEKIGFGSDIKTNSFISKIGIVLPLK